MYGVVKMLAELRSESLALVPKKFLMLNVEPDATKNPFAGR